MAYTLAILEDALLARIREQLPYLAAVEGYAGQIKEVEGEMAIQGVRFPAVLTLLQEGSGASQSKDSDEISVTWRLLVCCRNLRGEAAARRDDRGAYRILDDLMDALARQKLGLQISRIQYTRTEAVIIRPDNVVYAADYKYSYSYP